MKNTYLKWTKSVHNLIILFLSILFVFSLFGCKKSFSNNLIVYTYNSFSDEWGAGPKIAELFYKKYGVQIEFADSSDSGQLLSKLIMEKNNPYADVVIGLDNEIAKKAFENDVLINYVPKNANLIPEVFFKELNPNMNSLLSDENIILIPFDYSYFAFVFNNTSEIKKPVCLEDLTLPEYNKKIILMNPKTSTPGLGFQNWVNKVYGENASDYMKRLEPSILTVAPSWSIGYGMFTDGEAPLVISYTTSPAYHLENEEGDMFETLIFSDGHLMQIEGAGIVKGTKKEEIAKTFIDFLISKEAQEIIPLTQWMYPVNQEVILPESYIAAKIPENRIN